MSGDATATNLQSGGLNIKQIHYILIPREPKSNQAPRRRQCGINGSSLRPTLLLKDKSPISLDKIGIFCASKSLAPDMGKIITEIIRIITEKIFLFPVIIFRSYLFVKNESVSTQAVVVPP